MIDISLKKALLIIFVFIFCLSLAFNVWLAFQLSITLKAYDSRANSDRVLQFTGMFVEDVLMADREIDFDTRLSLETSVRALNDQQIFDQWQRFTKSETKEDASNEAKLLLDLLIKKIKN